MRTHAAISAGLFVSLLTLLGCSGDQAAPTASTTGPSYFSSRTSVTFSFSCTDAGPSTVANVSIITSSAVGHLAPLHCGDQGSPVSNFKSWQYQITLTNQAENMANDCSSTRPVHKLGSINCLGGQSSSVLTAQ